MTRIHIFLDVAGDIAGHFPVRPRMNADRDPRPKPPSGNTALGSEHLNVTDIVGVTRCRVGGHVTDSRGVAGFRVEWIFSHLVVLS